MNILDRIFLAIHMLIMIFVSLLIIIIPFNLLPLSLVDDAINELYSNWYFSLIGLLLLLISIKLLLSGIKTNKRGRDGIIKSSEYGDITISLDTFESMAIKAINQVSGIKDAKVKVINKEGVLIIYTSLFVLPDVNIPQIASEVQSKIKSHIESIAEVGVQDVKVHIQNVAQITAHRVN